MAYQTKVPQLWPKRNSTRAMIKTYSKTHFRTPATLLNHFEQHSGNQTKIMGLNLVSAWKNISGYLYYKSNTHVLMVYSGNYFSQQCLRSSSEQRLSHQGYQASLKTIMSERSQKTFKNNSHEAGNHEHCLLDSIHKAGNFRLNSSRKWHEGTMMKKKHYA
jgi:hypothetical protein